MSDLKLIDVNSEALKTRRFWVDVVCTDPFWLRETRRIEVHRDVAEHILKRQAEVERLHDELEDARKCADLWKIDADRYRTALEQVVQLQGRSEAGRIARKALEVRKQKAPRE